MSEAPSDPPELTEAERDELLARIDEIATNLRRTVEESRRERQAFRASMETFRTDLIEHLRANSRRILRELLLKYFPDYSEEEIDEAFALADAQQGQPLIGAGHGAAAPPPKPAKPKRAPKAPKKPKPRPGGRP